MALLQWFKCPLKCNKSQYISGERHTGGRSGFISETSEQPSKKRGREDKERSKLLLLAHGPEMVGLSFPIVTKTWAKCVFYFLFRLVHLSLFLLLVISWFSLISVTVDCCCYRPFSLHPFLLVFVSPRTVNETSVLGFPFVLFTFFCSPFMHTHVVFLLSLVRLQPSPISSPFVFQVVFCVSSFNLIQFFDRSLFHQSRKTFVSLSTSYIDKFLAPKQNTFLSYKLQVLSR